MAATAAGSAANGGHAGELTVIARPTPHRADAKPAPETASGAPDLAARLARALGVPAAELGAADAEAFAEQLAVMAALAAELLHEQLAPRDGRTRALAPQGNNPLEMFADKASAMRALFGPPQRLFLDPVRAFRQGLEELRQGQTRLKSEVEAERASVARLSPEAITAAAGKKGLLGLQKARLWDSYLAVWAELRRPESG